ncbi:hypothetical protein [Marinomonas posidonica]|uniref:hypothetical protein n=1 Tax=Marinomonas posidonica TaxID=936476 RepID=UPI0037353B7A
MVISSFASAIQHFLQGQSLTQVFINIINANIIAIAVFELAMVIKEGANKSTKTQSFREIVK